MQIHLQMMKIRSNENEIMSLVDPIGNRKGGILWSG